MPSLHALAVIQSLTAPSTELPANMIVVLGGFIGLLLVVALILNVVTLSRNLFRRTPPIEIDLQGKASKDHVDRLEVNLKGFASTKELEKYQEETRIRARGLEEQISGLRHELREECQALKSAAEVREATAADQFQDLRRQLSGTEKTLAAIEERTRNTDGRITAFDAKLDRIIERRAAVA